MSLTLWGRASSVNVQKVLWALDEFELGYDHKIVGGIYGGNDDPEFAALTPLRKVPVLQDGDFAVWESNAVLRHIARRQEDHPIAREMNDAVTAARTDPWLDFGTGTLQPPFITLFWQRVRLKPDERDRDADAASHAAVAAALTVIERGLSDGRAYLAGEEFGLADIALGTPMYRIFDVAPDLADPVPGVVAWYNRLAERPAHARHVAVSYDELRAG